MARYRTIRKEIEAWKKVYGHHEVSVLERLLAFGPEGWQNDATGTR